MKVTQLIEKKTQRLFSAERIFFDSAHFSPSFFVRGVAVKLPFVKSAFFCQRSGARGVVPEEWSGVVVSFWQFFFCLVHCSYNIILCVLLLLCSSQSTRSTSTSTSVVISYIICVRPIV